MKKINRAVADFANVAPGIAGTTALSPLTYGALQMAAMPVAPMFSLAFSLAFCMDVYYNGLKKYDAIQASRMAKKSS